MMKNIWFGFITLLCFFISNNIAYAGLMLDETEVYLSPLEKQQICFGVWTGREGTTHHVVSFSEEIAPFVDSFSPTEFDLEPVPCTTESKARRECIKELCMNESVQYCQMVCIDFEGPMWVSLFPEETLYEGSVKDESYKGSSKIVIPYSMKVYYTPFDLKIIIILVVFAIISVIALVYFWKLRKPIEIIEIEKDIN